MYYLTVTFEDKRKVRTAHNDMLKVTEQLMNYEFHHGIWGNIAKAIISKRSA